MKKLLILIAFPLFCSGQNKPKLDTIPVILLVCDTSLQSQYVPEHWKFITDTTLKLGFGVAGWDEYEPAKTIYYYNREVKWMNGYEVTQQRLENSGMPPYFMVTDHITYLDEKRQSLKESIIVWMSKPRK